ncbi:MAG: hypothetical protein KDA60_17350, partial [Planctomycetales bacterium]|nr:hypothetical protein [Planctomycetales bacterium]
MLTRPLIVWDDGPSDGPDTTNATSPAPIDVAIPEASTEQSHPGHLAPVVSASEIDASNVRPQVLRPPHASELNAPNDYPDTEEPETPRFRLKTGFPLGFSGRSGVMPTTEQADAHFVPVEDRWRIGFADWDRYDKDFPVGVDYAYKKGSLWNPYTQNV